MEAGQEILQAGGNAFDAAVGAMFAAMVAEPTLTSAGGSGHFMALPESGEPILFDFFVDMPTRELDPNDMEFFHVQVDFGLATQGFHIGRASAAVPGNVAGLMMVQDKLGVLHPREVLAPAIEAARDGVVLSQGQALVFEILRPILTHEERGRSIFAPNGHLLQEGDVLRLPEFSDFLDALAREGPDLFYKGEVARIILEWAREGGLLRAEDLARYQVRQRAPLRADFRGFQVLLNPPPAQSGVLIDLTLSLLERDVPADAASISLPRLVAALDVTDQARADLTADILNQEIIQPLTRQSRFDPYLNRFLRLVSPTPSPTGETSQGATTHVSVLDKWGNAGSVTTSNGEGCGSMLPQVGFMLNNMLGEEDINPNGFHQHVGGARLASMIAPTIVLEGGKPILVTGTGGSTRIRSVIVQLLVNLFCRKLSIQEATAAPRIHLENGVLHAEPGVSEQCLTDLSSRYSLNQWSSQSPFFGGAHSVTPEGGAGDARRGGHSAMWF